MAADRGPGAQTRGGDRERLSAHFGTIRLVVRDVSNDQAKLEVLLPSHIRLDEPSGRTLASHSRTGGKPSKNGFQYGSLCRPLAIARPMAGTWDVVMVPTIFAMT